LGVDARYDTWHEDTLADFTLQFSKHQVLLITTGEVVTEEIISAVYSAVERFVASEGPCSGISDFSAAEDVRVSAEFVRRLAARSPAIPAGRRRVVVAPRPDFYGLTRMFQILRDGMSGELHVVRTMVEAYDFLAISSTLEFSAIDTERSESATE